MMRRERTAASLVPVRKGLRTLAESLRKVAGLVENMDDLLGAVKFSDPPKRDISPPDLLHDKTPSVLLPTEAAALHRLTKLVEDMRRGVRMELNTLLSLYYRMDVEPLFALAMRKVIPSFQTVTGETLRQALDAFMNTGEGQKREDLELLLKVGAAVDAVVEVPQGESQAGVIEKVRETALVRAVSFGSLEAVKILVGAGAVLELQVSGGMRALHVACQKGRSEVAKYLVCSGAELEARSEKGVTPLQFAATSGAVDLVHFLLTQGANVHATGAFGHTALFAAVRFGRKDVVQLLLDRGARVNERDQYGQTPLFCTARIDWGCFRDLRDIAELLISRGADIHARDEEGRTVIHFAAGSGAMNVFNLLLTRGADPLAVDDVARSALHYVAFVLDSKKNERHLFAKKLRIARRLVSVGVDIGAGGGGIGTALDVAEEHQPADSPVFELLRVLNSRFAFLSSVYISIRG